MGKKVEPTLKIVVSPETAIHYYRATVKSTPQMIRRRFGTYRYYGLPEGLRTAMAQFYRALINDGIMSIQEMRLVADGDFVMSKEIPVGTHVLTTAVRTAVVFKTKEEKSNE